MTPRVIPLLVVVALLGPATCGVSHAQGVDPTFVAAVDGTVFALAVDSTGRILVGGRFNSVNGGGAATLVRLLPNGGTDTTFDGSAAAATFRAVRAVALQPDGRVVAAGEPVSTSDSTQRRRIARFHADGSVDSSLVDPFVTLSGPTRLNAVVVQSDGGIVVGGNLQFIDTAGTGQTLTGLVRLRFDGTVDSSFMPNPSGVVRAIAQLPDGRLLIAGTFTSVAGDPTRPYVARLLPGGAADSTFAASSVSPDVQALAIRHDGSVMVAPVRLPNDTETYAVLLNSTGEEIPSFRSRVGSNVGAASMLPIDLGTLGGAFSEAIGMNDQGQVVGASATAAGAIHGFVWSASRGMEDLGQFNGRSTYAKDINNAGEIIGNGVDWADFFGDRAFRWSSSSGYSAMPTCDAGDSDASSINDDGDAVGVSCGYRPTLWPSGGGSTFVDLGPLDGPRSIGWANALNDAGTIVGGAAGDPGPLKAWRRAGSVTSVLTELAAPLEFSHAYGVNQFGTAVGDVGTSAAGSSTRRAALWSPSGAMTVLGTIGQFNSLAWGVNNRNEVVGIVCVTASCFGPVDYDYSLGLARAFLWTSISGLQPLPGLSVTSTNSRAWAINEQGHIAGRSRNARGEDHATLWVTPGNVTSMAAYPDGRTVVAGAPLNVLRDTPVHLAGRLAANGTVDPAFRLPAQTACCVYVTALQSASAVLLGGDNLLVRHVDPVSTAPGPPGGLVVSEQTAGGVTLRWDPPVLGPAPTGYVLEGGVTPGQVLASVQTGTPSPISTVAIPPGTYYVRVHALANGQRSGASNEIRVFVGVPVAPSAPANLLATVNGTYVGLAWRNTHAGGAPSEIVLDVTGTTSGTVPVGLAEGVQFDAVPPGSYHVSARARNASGVSASSNVVSVTVPSPCSGSPLTPARFLVDRVGRRLSVVWEPGATGPAPASYVLAVGGSFVGSVVVVGRSVSGDVSPGTYQISVSAVNACGTSPSTAVQTVTVP